MKKRTSNGRRPAVKETRDGRRARRGPVVRLRHVDLLEQMLAGMAWNG